jgi:GT2 family glycosyltransferase
VFANDPISNRLEDNPMASKADVSVASTAGLVSIVIPCCGMLEYTKLCVPSLLRYSRPPFELIFLDVGSLDGTAEYLDGLRAGLAGKIRMEVVRAPIDLGLKDACQQAIGLTLGEYVVLLNNDTVVTNGWLNQLIGLASFSMTIGMVGPVSNMAAPPQLVETVPYRVFSNTVKTGANPNGVLVDTTAVERFAEKHRVELKGNWLYAERLGGFCLLIKREVLDKIGSSLDPWTDLSLFDSDILSAKAKQAGYSLAVCRDLFVHHFGTRTFAHGPKTTPNSSASQV